jgi:hypothetical protein
MIDADEETITEEEIIKDVEASGNKTEIVAVRLFFKVTNAVSDVIQLNGDWRSEEFYSALVEQGMASSYENIIHILTEVRKTVEEKDGVLRWVGERSQ